MAWRIAAGTVGDPILARNPARRTDFAPFMVESLSNDETIDEAPADAERDIGYAAESGAASTVAPPGGRPIRHWAPFGSGKVGRLRFVGLRRLRRTKRGLPDPCV